MAVDQASTIKSFNPATGELLGEAPCLNADEVQAAVDKAWSSFEEWQLLDYAKRRKLILNLHKVLRKHSDEIAKLITQEVGKPLFESYTAEITGSLDACIWFAENSEKALKDQTIGMTNPLLASKQSIISFEPIGVVGIISPWNYPFAIPMIAIIMSVMVGNTVVLKPSEKCPLIGIKIEELFAEAGFPEGVVTVITGDRTTGQHLCQTSLAKILFTGSVEGGSKVMAQAAKTLTPVGLELGGKDAAIVLPDAPTEWTAKGLVWGAFTNCGQACASIERVYVVKSKNTEKLISYMMSYTEKLRLGDGLDPKTEIGPVIDEGQLAKIEKQVNEARNMGATVVCGGNRRKDLTGHFYEPTILTNVDHSMDVMTKETFGPVLPVMVVNSEDEAIELANDSEYGLSASIWTKNLTNAEDIARDLEVGTVFINDGLFSFACPQLPWGGLKKSGFGRTHSYFGLLDLVNIKHITIDSAGGPTRLWWYPYGHARIEIVKAGAALLHGDVPHKVKGLFDFVINSIRGIKS